MEIISFLADGYFEQIMIMLLMCRSQQVHVSSSLRFIKGQYETIVIGRTPKCCHPNDNNILQVITLNTASHN